MGIEHSLPHAFALQGESSIAGCVDVAVPRPAFIRASFGDFRPEAIHVLTHSAILSQQEIR